MTDLDPITRTLLVLLDNQVARTARVFEALDPGLLEIEPGGDCKSILGIGRHLIGLRAFQLELLGSSLAGEVENAAQVATGAELIGRIGAATELVRGAIAAHDPGDWLLVPNTPREGLWGDEPTLHRVIRPLNDFTNHLGGIRVIRRVHGNPAARTQ